MDKKNSMNNEYKGFLSIILKNIEFFFTNFVSKLQV